MSLATKYRPTSFDDVIGHDAAVAALKRLRSPRCIMISGPSGCGKTTLARIVARELLHVEEPEEVNGSDRTKVEDWRETIEAQSYTLLGGEKRVILIDECQMLSKSSWSALLKPMEDAPEGWHWILCTTEPHKVPIANRNRCHHIEVQSLQIPALEEILRVAIDGECQDPTEGDTPKRIRMVAKAANGCPREALSKYELVAGAGTMDEVRLLLDQEGEESDGISKLCNSIIRGEDLDWKTVLGHVGKPTNGQAEKYRERIASYLAKVAFDGNVREGVFAAMELFAERYQPETARASFAISLAGLVYGSE